MHLLWATALHSVAYSACIGPISLFVVYGSKRGCKVSAHLQCLPCIGKKKGRKTKQETGKEELKKNLRKKRRQLICKASGSKGWGQSCREVMWALEKIFSRDPLVLLPLILLHFPCTWMKHVWELLVIPTWFHRVTLFKSGWQSYLPLFHVGVLGNYLWPPHSPCSLGRRNLDNRTRVWKARVFLCKGLSAACVRQLILLHWTNRGWVIYGVWVVCRLFIHYKYLLTKWMCKLLKFRQ